MCLQSPKYIAPVSVGYKFYLTQLDSEKIPFFSPLYGNMDEKYYGGRWYNAENDDSRWHICATNGDYYPIGFHLIRSKIDAYRFLHTKGQHAYQTSLHEDWLLQRNKWGTNISLLEVEYTGVLAHGIDCSSIQIAQAGIQCVVAARMRICNVIGWEQIPAFLKNAARKRAPKKANDLP